MSVSEIIYIIAVSFQVSGALLLIVQFWCIKIKKGIEENKKKETHVEGETLVLGKTQPTSFEYTNNVWLNRFAFVLIALGYLLGVFGNIEMSNRFFILFWIILSSSFLVALFVSISKKLGKSMEEE